MWQVFVSKTRFKVSRKAQRPLNVFAISLNPETQVAKIKCVFRLTDIFKNVNGKFATGTSNFLWNDRIWTFSKEITIIAEEERMIYIHLA